MADEKREKLVQHKSPKGIAKWVTLNKPDTKYKKEGQYRVTLLLTPEEAKPIQELIDAGIEQAKKMWKDDPKLKGKKVKEADTPYAMDVDKEGNETGKVKFNFTAKAGGKRKDGSEWTFRPMVFDAKGGKVPSNVNIFGGSTVKVAYEIYPWATVAVGAGVSLRLKAVQVLELKTLGECDASAFGFGEEDGYVSDGEEDEQVTGGDAGSQETPPDDNPDF
jgi:hypothetical protein